MHHKRFMPLVRELMECAQGFERQSTAHVRGMGLTRAQFDILATLGNTAGMTCKELGARTLITKGTLTGVLDRMEARGLLVREASPDDARSWITRLTRKGDALFDDVFPRHMSHLQPYFAGFSDADLAAMREQLRRLRSALAPGTAP